MYIFEQQLLNVSNQIIKCPDEIGNMMLTNTFLGIYENLIGAAIGTQRHLYIQDWV